MVPHQVYSRCVSFSHALKRLLVGRKLASTQLGETLLPKRIALPVFASDALSSTAYAPERGWMSLMPQLPSCRATG